MKQLFAQKLRLTLDRGTHELLKQYAVFARRPMAALAAGIVADFLAQRAELGDGLPATDHKVQRTPIIQELIGNLEQRVAATLNGHGESMYSLQTQLRRITIMIDMLAEAVLLHAPQTPPHEAEAIMERGKLRHERWRALVEKESETRT